MVTPNVSYRAYSKRLAPAWTDRSSLQVGQGQPGNQVLDASPRDPLPLCPCAILRRTAGPKLSCAQTSIPARGRDPKNADPARGDRAQAQDCTGGPRALIRPLSALFGFFSRDL